MLGYATGAVSMISDGFHPLADSASNVMAMVGLRASRKPPDDDHPYGHRTFETLAAGGIAFFLVVEAIYGALHNPQARSRLRSCAIPRRRCRSIAP